MRRFKQMPQDNLVFIVGCPRSGTTLLALLLESSMGIAFPVETHFIPFFRSWSFLWGDLSKYKNRLALLNAIFEFLEIWTPRVIAGRDMPRLMEYTLLSVKPDRARIARSSNNFQDLIANLFSEYARKRNLEISGDKSAFYAHISLTRLHKAVPGAKFIHLIRDGRDVFLSWEKIRFGPVNAEKAAHLWRKHLQGKHNWGRKHPGRYLEVRYEALVSSPKRELDRISAFLGKTIKISAKGAHTTPLAELMADRCYHPLINRAVTCERVGKWRHPHNRETTVSFERKAGDLLKQYGYPLSQNRSAFISNNRSNTSGRGDRKLVIDKIWTAALRSLKPLLPFSIWLSSKIGLRLSRLFPYHT